jgi:hypothetical protein
MIAHVKRISLPAPFVGRTILLAALLCPGTDAASIVVPSENATVPAAGATFLFQPNNSHYLALYEPSYFLDAMPQGALITRVTLRLDESVRNSVSAVVPDVEIRMSTGPSGIPVSDQGTRFSSFAGKDELVVVQRGALSFHANAAGSGANPFELAIPLKTPFPYDPRSGRLAMDIRIYGEESSRIYIDGAIKNALVLAGDVRSDVVLGLAGAPVILVDFEAVPEPRGECLLVFGTIVIGTMQAGKKRR